MSVSILVSGQKKVVADILPVGMITLISEATSIYTGSEWLDCDGGAVSRTTYADLFAAIGTTFGPGDGTTTFNLPNADPTVVSGAQTFSAFIAETVITVDNGTPLAIDIHSGAVKSGIRVTILHQSAQTLTIYTDAAHTQSCEMPKGTLVLVWDNTASQLCIVGQTVKTLHTITANITWKTPFAATYTFMPVGGGGGGGGATGDATYPGYAGGGAAGSCQQFTKYEPAGTSVAIVIGTGGNGNTGYGTGTAGGNTSIADGTITVYGMGGLGGGGIQGSMMGQYGGGGNTQNPPVRLFTDQLINGGNGGSGSGSYSGSGGKGPENLGGGSGGAGVTANHDGNNGSNYGGGGSGGASSSSQKDGGNGATGVAYIQY